MLKAKARSGRWYSRRRAFARARKQILSRDGFRCRAFVTCPNDKNLAVHHVYAERWVRRWMKGADPHIPENLITVCRAHHAELTAAEAPLFAGNYLEFARRNNIAGISREQICTAMRALSESCKNNHK